MGRWSCAGLLLGSLGLVGMPVGLAQVEGTEAIQEQDHRVTELINQLQTNPSPHERNRAAQALGEIGAEEAIEPLVAALQDYHGWVRTSAANALAEISLDVLSELVITALRDPNSEVREWAARALKQINLETTIEPWTIALQDSSSEVRSIAAQVLGQTGSEVAVAPLIAALEDPNSGVRSNVAQALGQTGSEIVVAPLIATLKDPNSGVRSNVAQALGQIASEVAVAPLIAALKDPNRGVRANVAQALGQIGPEVAIAPLIATLKDPNSRVRANVAQTLGQIGPEAAVTYLLKALQDPDHRVRKHVAEALEQIDTEIIIHHLSMALQDPDSAVRESAIEILGKMGSSTAISHLNTALQDSDPGIRSRAAIALGEISLQAENTLHILALQDNLEPEVRSSAVEALGEVYVQAMNNLSFALQDPGYWVRKNAVEALEKISLQAANVLNTALRDRDLNVRKHAIEALGEINSQATDALNSVTLQNSDLAISDLAICKQDDDKHLSPTTFENCKIHNLAVEVLAEINPQATDALTIALQDSDSGVRRRAAEALGSLIGTTDINAIVQALGDMEDPIVRRGLIDILQPHRHPDVTVAIVNHLNTTTETSENRYLAIGALFLPHHHQNLVDSHGLLTTLSNLARTEGEEGFVRYGALVLLSSVNTPEAMDLLNTHKSEFLNLLETNYVPHPPFNLPKILPSETDSPNPFEGSTLIAANLNSPTRNTLPLEVWEQQPTLPSIPQGANPEEVREEVAVYVEGKPRICGFAWIAQHWQRCWEPSEQANSQPESPEPDADATEEEETN
jgi:HEAT repeat protein